MSGRAEIWLAIIAISTLLTAVVQIILIVYGIVLARRMARLVTQLEEELSLLGESANAIARDASRATSLALAQVERVDRLFANLTSTLEETVSTVQHAVIAPIREGTALMAAFRAALEIFRDFANGVRGGKGKGQEDDGMFIG